MLAIATRLCWFHDVRRFSRTYCVRSTVRLIESENLMASRDNRGRKIHRTVVSIVLRESWKYSRTSAAGNRWFRESNNRGLASSALTVLTHLLACSAESGASRLQRFVALSRNKHRYPWRCTVSPSRLFRPRRLSEWCASARTLSAKYAQAGAAATSNISTHSHMGDEFCYANRSSRCAVKSRYSAVQTTQRKSETSPIANSTCFSYWTRSATPTTRPIL